MYPGSLPPGQTSPVQIEDWSHWKHINEFTVLEVACLWAGIEPLVNLRALRCSPEAAGRYRMLTDAIDAGGLGNYPRRWFKVPEIVGLGFGGKLVAHQWRHLPKMRMSRDELVKYANSIGEQPLFLFPTLAALADAVNDEPHLSPYLSVALQVAIKLNITPDSQPKKTVIESELKAAWPKGVSASNRLISALATLMREPESQSGRAKKTRS